MKIHNPDLEDLARLEKAQKENTQSETQNQKKV